MDKRTRIISLSNLILILAAIWLVASPYLLGYLSPVAKNNDILVGIVVGVVALLGLFFRSLATNSLSWILGLVGLWEISSSFSLGYSNEALATNNAVIVGIIIIAFSLAQVLSIPEDSEVITRHFGRNTYGPTFASGIRKTRDSQENDLESEED